jgi:hypothetical protein
LQKRLKGSGERHLHRRSDKRADLGSTWDAINHILQLLFNRVGQEGRAFFNMDLCRAHELALFGRGSLSKHARCSVDK